jgi:hypothetical protein
MATLTRHTSDEQSPPAPLIPADAVPSVLATKVYGNYCYNSELVGITLVKDSFKLTAI